MKNIRLVCPITSQGFRRLEDLKAAEGPGFEISLSQIEAGPASIECEFDEMLAVPDTVAKIIQAEREGADAVVIDCMTDPGLMAGREAVRIPVLGPCQTSMHLAAMLGHRFSVLTMLHRMRSIYENRARIYGLHEKMVSIRSVEIPVLDLEDDPEKTISSLTDQALLAVEKDGADVIIFGCTGMLGCAEGVMAGLLGRGHNLPVIDPVPTTIRIAAALVEAGHSHSQAAYPPPSAKPVAGYPQPEFTDRSPG